jgi:hypothetical protein
MVRKYSLAASKEVGAALHAEKRGKLKSGKDGKGGVVKSRKQAIAIGLAEARKKGKKVPAPKAAAKTTKTRTTKTKTAPKSTAKKS